MVTLNDDLHIRAIAIQAMQWYGSLSTEDKIAYIDNLTYTDVMRLIRAVNTFIGYQSITRDLALTDDFDPLILEDLVSRLHSRLIREGW